MFYLLTNPESLNFLNTAQEKTVDITTNGTVALTEDLSWISAVITESNFKADSDSDGRRNTDVINVFEPAGSNAARACIDYRATGFQSIVDWYLPSIDQMDDLLLNSSFFSSFPLSAPEYWSSTEDITTIGTSAKSITSGNVVNVNLKSALIAARPVRQLSYSEVNPPYSVGDDLGYGIVFNINTTDKLIYIASKEDLPAIIWGVSTDVSNANFATSMTATTLVNERYVELKGVINLSLSEDETIYTDVVVTQDSSDEDSRSVLFKEIIDNVVLGNISERSFAYGIPRFQAIMHGKRLMQELNYNGLQDVRVYEGVITEANKFIPPVDFVDYIRLSVVNFEGRLLPLFYNNKLNISFQYVEDSTGNIVVDDQGYPIKTQGSRRTENSSTLSYRFYDGYPGEGYGYGYDTYARSLPGITGGQESYTGSYRFDHDAGEFLLDSIPDNFTTVILEYMSDPILAEKNPERLRIHKYFQDAMEAGIYFRLIRHFRDVPAYEKERAKKEYYNYLRVAKRRLNTKPHEIIQKLGADIGFNKTL